MTGARGLFLGRLLLTLALLLGAGLGPARAQDPAAGSAADAATGAAATAEPGAVAAGAVADTSGIDYDAWESFAARVEAALESGRVSDSVLGDLRNELVAWREGFADAKAVSTVRIRLLRAQIETLGAAPAEGASEAASTAFQRARLTAELDTVLAPVTRAELAYTRADTLVTMIDQAQRSRQAQDITAQGPTPFDPTAWAPAVESLVRTFSLAWSAAIESWSNSAKRAGLVADLPLSATLLIAGVAFLVLGWRSVRRTGDRLRANVDGAVRGAWGFVIAALQVIVPSFGALLIGSALRNAFALDTRGHEIVSAFVAIVVVQFVARWLGNRVFGIPGAGWRVLELSGGRVREGHAMTASLGVLIGLQVLLNNLRRIDAYSDATLAVLNFPLIVVTAVVFWRLGRLMRVFHGADAGEADAPTTFYNRTVRVLGTLLAMIAVAAPLAAAMGYRNAATFLLFPSIYTLALIAALMILHHFIIDIFALIARLERDQAVQSLVPVLISVGVAIAATPLLPLIWGYRVSDLTEFWTKLRAGVSLGDAVITPMTALTVAVVFAIGYAATRLVQGMLGSTILPKTSIDAGGQNAITSGVGYVGIFIAGVAAVTAAGINLSSLAIVAGALSVGIGFGLQTIVSNFVSGIILLIERPIGDGDWIEVGGIQGTVKAISVRSTRIVTFDRTEVIVPNSDLISGVVTNYTRGNLLGRVIVRVGVAYGTDTRKVERILNEVAQAHPLVTVNPEPQVLFVGFGADSLDFEVRMILRDVNFAVDVSSEINHEIARSFTEAGIEIPFAQRDIWLRNPEALAALTGARGGGTAEPKIAPKIGPEIASPEAEGPRRVVEPEAQPETHGYGPQETDDD